MPRYEITLDDLVIIRDITHYLYAVADNHRGAGLTENANGLFKEAKKLEGIVSRLLERNREDE